ncbi:peptidase C14, partial [Aureobasidium melanogenum]
MLYGFKFCCFAFVDIFIAWLLNVLQDFGFVSNGSRHFTLPQKSSRHKRGCVKRLEYKKCRVEDRVIIKHDEGLCLHSEVSMCANEGPRHGTSRLTSDGSIRRGLVVLATTPHDDISGRSLGALVLFIAVIAPCDLLEQAHSSTRHTANVATSIAADNAQQALAGFFGKVGLLEYTLSGIDIWQIQSGARVARVEDGSQSHTGGEILDHDEMHLVVNNVTCLAEVDRVDDFVVAVFFVTVEIFSLTTCMARRMFCLPPSGSWTCS